MSPSDVAISVRGLSKSYTIAHDQEKHVTLAESMLSRLRRPLRRPRTETFWALKDVSFDVRRGDVVGIIGRNGAGKSTLLKILSRITEPTEGRIDLYGRVGSLLEVGTGFHPELTGRENIFLNGAILGMSKAEIRKQFDAIVDFAGVEKFLDTPVKRYSSGMYVRLAFAVAAHLNPEILIVDEVLAVGDAEFQRKCLGKMKDVASGGRTVLFVSHQMANVADLCQTGLWLSEGRIARKGDVQSVIDGYLSTESSHGVVDLRTWHGDRKGNGPMRIVRMQTEQHTGERTSAFDFGEPISVRLWVVGPPGAMCHTNVSIRDAHGQIILHPHSTDDGVTIRLVAEESEILAKIDPAPIQPGTYYITGYIEDEFRACNDRVGNCLAFRIRETPDRSVRSRSPFWVRATWKAERARTSLTDAN